LNLEKTQLLLKAISKWFICGFGTLQHPNVKVEVKDTTECSPSALYLDILLKLDANYKLTTQYYDKRDYSKFPIVNLPYLCSNIVSSPACGVYILQLLRYARAQLLIRGSILTNKLMPKGFLQSPLQTAFRKFNGHYNNLVCHNILP
jgi:hypothetical protein